MHIVKYLKNSLMIVLLLTIMLSSCYAYSFDSFYTEIEVYSDGVSKISHEIILDSSNIDKGFVIPAYSPESLIITDESGDLKFGTIGINLIIQPKEKKEDYKVNIQYLTNDLTIKKNGEWILQYMIPAYDSMAIKSIKRSSIMVFMPESATILSTEPQGIIFTDKNYIKVGFKPEIKQESDNEFTIRYSNRIEKKKDIPFLYILTLVGTGMALALLVFLIFKTYKDSISDFLRNSKISTGKRTIMKTLESKEKDVLKILLNENKEVYQSKIQRVSGISKATLSRIVKRLESKNLINIETQGNTNILSVQNWFMKK